MIAFLVLAQVLDSYAGLGLDRLPDIERDDLRLVVLGDSFAGQSRSRIPTALLSELPEGQLVGVRTSVHTLYARPVRSCCLKDTWWSMIRDSLRAAENLNWMLGAMLACACRLVVVTSDSMVSGDQWSLIGRCPSLNESRSVRGWTVATVCRGKSSSR